MGKYKHTLVIESDLDEKDFKRAVETIWLVNSFSPGKLLDFKTRSLVPKSVAVTPTPRYFKWIADVCALLGWEKAEGADLVEDVSWFGCFDDGMSPSAAVAEAKARGVLVSIVGKWVYQPRNFTEEAPKKNLIVGGDRSHELIQEPADGGGFASREPYTDIPDGGK